jgi:hypothetical protein
MAKQKKFARSKPDVMVLKRYREYIYMTDMHGTQVCNRACKLSDAVPDGKLYCETCRVHECTRNCDPASTRVLWQQINSIAIRI